MRGWEVHYYGVVLNYRLKSAALATTRRLGKDAQLKKRGAK